jgi:glycosyltransferase involved in cell wall biosynthesis
MSESPSRSPISISVLIPAFNEEALIAETIGHVRQSFENVGHTLFEIIVCDNNSTDRTGEIARANGARVVFEPHNQISRARNAAALHAQHDWLIFLDADTLLPAELLCITIETMSRGEVCGGGAYVTFNLNNPGFGARALAHFWNTLSRVSRLAAGSYIFCRRTAWVETGGFSEKVYAGEELFFSHSLKRWGKRNGLGFRVLPSPVKTSARKLDWYSPWQIIRQMLPLAFPGAMQRRENCALWYSRPGGTAPERPRT